MANQPLYIDQGLTNVSNAYLNQDKAFIANKIFPEVLVKNSTFKVAEYGPDTLRIPSSTVRTGEAKAKRVGLDRSFATYGPLQEHTLADFVTRDDYLESDTIFDPEADAVENIHHKLDLSDEKDLATMLSDTAVVTQNTTLSGTSQWNDYGNSDPFEVLRAATQAATVRKFNTIFMGDEVWSYLISHPAFLDRVKWSDTGVLSEQAMKTLLAPLGIKNIFVGSATENTAAEGQTATFGDVWGKNLWLQYLTDRPSRKELNGGYKFRRQDAREVTREPMNNPPGTEIIVRDHYDHIILNTDCFYLIKDVVA